MHMTGNGADITFLGHVHSVMQPADVVLRRKDTGAIGLRPSNVHGAARTGGVRL